MNEDKQSVITELTLQVVVPLPYKTLFNGNVILILPPTGTFDCTVKVN